MLSPKHIKNMTAVELPEVEQHGEFDITEVYDTYDSLLHYLQQIIKVGKITKYKLTDSNIQYRGITTQVYIYESAKQFKKLDIFAGLNKEALQENIVCRIMPIKNDNKIKWIGIYLKSACK